MSNRSKGILRCAGPRRGCESLLCALQLPSGSPQGRPTRTGEDRPTSRQPRRDAILTHVTFRFLGKFCFFCGFMGSWRFLRYFSGLSACYPFGGTSVPGHLEKPSLRPLRISKGALPFGVIASGSMSQGQTPLLTRNDGKEEEGPTRTPTEVEKKITVG